MKNVEDIYPLTPLQSGMLFHSLLAPESGVYVNQVTCTLPADLDAGLFRQAWERLVDRHGVLRTAFLWDGLDAPVQVVRKKVPLPWQELDWRGLSAEEQQRRFEELGHRERHTPLPLGKAPLMRFSLIRLGHGHGLVWTSHHLLLDGWSLPLLVRELQSVYAALREGREPLAPRVRPFSDYVVWLRKQDSSRAEPFWRQELAGFTAPNALGIDRPGRVPEGAAPEAAGTAEHGLRISREVTARLQTLASRHKLTLPTLTLGAWGVLLSRYSGEEDVVFGNVVSGRPAALPGVETMVGMFINTLPVRVRVNGAEPLGLWLQRLQERQLARQELEHSPLAEIQRWSEVPAGSPLFETLHVFESYPSAGDGGSGSLPIGDLRLFESTNYPVNLILAGADQILLQVKSDRARIDGDAALRLLGHLKALLEGIAEGFEQPLRNLPSLSEAELHQVLLEWNDTEWSDPGAGREETTLIHEPFEAWAARTPDAVAVVWEGVEISYGRIEERANRLARHLARRGLRRGALAGIHLRRGPDMIVALLAVLKAGAAYVPLEIGHPPARLRLILGALEISCLLTESAQLGTVREIQEGLPAPLDAVCLDLVDLEGCAASPPPRRSTPDDLAYVIFTSGSTGTPKGVMVRHRPVINLLRWAYRTFSFSPVDRVLFVTSLSFDLSVFDVFGLLGAGGSVRIATEEEVRDPERLLRVLAEEPITFWDSAPAALEQTVPFLAGLAPGGRPALRLVFLSGDWIPVTLPDNIRGRFPEARVVSLGGATEATVWSNVFPVEEVAPGWTSIPYGRPIENARYHVLDAGLAPCPVSIAGDLYIGGDCLADGYAREPELTAAKFLPDPWSPQLGGRLYRTGDRARYQPDGNLEFLGRLDHQVKIRGFRVELGEIEGALAALPGVRDAVVVARQDPSGGRPGDRRLVAYVTGDASGPAADELRRSLRERLPDYMVPATFVKLERLPLTSNGKVDRKALPSPEGHGAEESRLAPRMPPRTPVEDILAGMWAGLLGLDRVGANAHFFELGGHSLLATQMISRLRGAFGVELPLRALFDAPVLEDLAARVEAALLQEDRRAGAGVMPIAPALREGPLPLSFAQQRLWFVDQLEPGSPLYNIPAALRVEGALDPAVVELCLGEIVRRHEALRTVFAVRDGSPVQVIRAAAPFVLPVIDLSGLPESRREAAASALTGEEAGRPFDLTRELLLRGVLLRLAERDSLLALTLHHIASDGWSMGILVREVAALYAAFAEGRPSPLPELPVQYADFVAWQRSWLRGEVLEREIAFWRRQLADLPPLLELPTDRPRPTVQSFRGAARPVRLPAALARRVEALARREGATPFMALLAGFQALLARYSGQDDLAVGSPIAGRNRVEIEGLIGFFVNTLVMRGDLRGVPTFRQLLGRVRETALAAYLHQDVPFEKLVEELAPERHLAHAPLFQVMFVLESAPLASLAIRDLRLRPAGGARTTAKLDLVLSLEQQEDGLSGAVEHATDLFDAATIDRLIGHYGRLLEAAVSGEDQPLADLPLLSAAELHQVRAEWNPGAASGAAGAVPDAPVVALFESWAERTPDAVAVLAPGEALSYAGLDRRANRLARRLRALGVTVDSRVGLCAERSPGMIVAVLGILKAGAAYVPLDPAYPRERLAFMVEDARIQVLLTEEHLLGSLPATPAATVLLDAQETGEAERLPGRRLETALPDSLAYVIYTSGSTGRPKGAMIPHRGWSNLADAQRRLFGLGPGDRVLQFASLSFDASAWEIAMAFGAGATLVLGPRERRLSRQELTALLADSTAALLPPTVLATLSPEDLPGLATLIVGGEACPVELARAWAAGRRLWNAYGPTEASVCATLKLYDGGERLPIGRPIARMQAHALDPRGNPVPPGVAGELCLGGPGLARGYLDRPDRTAASFVPHPLAASPGERLYRTGDLTRTRPDGEIEFLGRIDHQVKVRGYRIELGEIEAALARHPQVLESAVVLREDRPGDRRLVAYVVTAASPASLSSELRTFLRDSLPEFMVPAAFVGLAALPVSANGKVDFKALPRPVDGAERGEDYLAPRTPTEEILAGIWSDLLGVEKVGGNDDFFELGGHSLQGIRLLARVREVLGVDLPIRALFLTPTLAALAARISEEEQHSVGAARIPPLARRDGPLPLSFAQERLWFLEQLEPGSAFYNIPATIRMEGTLRFEALAASLEELTRRHEALRTTFGDLEGQPYQRIGTEARVGMPVVDLAALPPARREPELRQLATDESRRPFDLAHGPLMRVVLFRLAAGEQVIVHTTHHIISDGWSAVIFLREIAALYEAFSTGRPALLPALPVQYADYAAWQRSYLEGPVLENQLSYWRDRLTGAPGLELPTDRPRPAVETFRGASHPVRLPQEVGRALIALSRREGATLFMTLLALFKTLLLRTSGQSDLAVGSPIANRNRSDVENVIGFFSNTVVLRTDLSGDPSFRELLLRVREVALGAYAHEDLPFERIVEELQPERDMSRNPLFQVMCVLQNQPRESLPAGDLRMSPLSIELGIAKFDLTLFWYEEQGWLSGLLEYNTDLFDHSTALRFYQHYERLLASVLADPGRPLTALPLLDEAERHQLVIEWSDTATPAEGRCIHAWVEQQVELTPEAVAVVFGEQRLSYREVNLRANRLAHGLMRRGVGPESLVGICVDRSLEMVVAALAVLKSGGALVALDPAYPRERLATIIEDAGLTILLTQEPLLRHFPGHRGIALCLAPGGEPFPFESSENPRTGLTPDHPMYVIYTSGSTGQPKGIVVPHRAFANLASWQLGHAPSARAIRTVQFATFGFCVSFQEIFSAWCSGGTLVVADEMTRRDAERLAELLAAESIERLHLPFAALKQLADVRESFGDRPMRLREIITAGEQLRVTPAVRDLLDRLPGCSLHNQYGASETHVVCALALAGATAGWPAIPSVGRPIGNVRIHLLDSGLEPVPVGVRGDLYAGGACLARAYLKDPVLTAQKMVPDPFAMEPGARLYRTGDLARHLSDGQIEFLGRADGQVKIRGFRVELGEVETVMAGHPGVRDAVAVAQPVDGGGFQLVAYVVGAQGDLQVEELRGHLKQRLPDHMIPSAFVQLPALPLNANGKLDQAALPMPEAAGGPAGHMAPRTPAEELVAGLWAEVLHRERVGATDNFFDLGGHSLLATRLMSRLRGAFGVELPLRTLFERPTVAEMAAAVEEVRRGGLSPAALPLARAPRGQELPLSFAQERLWFLDRIDPGTPTYNMPGRVGLTGRLDVAALAAALRGLVERHEVLRTSFPRVDGIPHQRILPESETGMPVVDLAALPESARRAETERLAADHARHRFDLARGPLLDAVLVRLDPDHHQLLVVVHHVICDGWSLHLLVGEIGELYGCFAAGRPSSLGELPVQYADFALWQRQLVAATRQTELAWWLDLLSGEIAPMDLPTDRMRPAVQTYRGGLSSLVLSAGFAARLAAFGRAHGSTLFMTLLAAIKALLHRHSGQDDILVGAPVAGRRAVETEGLIGCFLNTLVLRTRLGGEPGFRDLVARVREVTLGAYSHQDVPFEAVLAGLPQPRDLSRTPLFQVMVNLLNLPSAELRLPGLVLESLAGAEPLSKFDMTFYLGEGDGVRIELVYNADLFDAGRMEDLLAQLEAFLDQALDRPEEPIGALSLVTAAARAVLPDPAAPLPAVWPGAVHERFAEQARRHPGRPALIDGDGVWSYGELETAANRLSAWLQGHGVRPGDRVAVYAHRSAPLALAVLGALKAGAAFTILDPAYPAARLTAALAATAPRAVLRLEAAGALPTALSDWLRDAACPALALPAGGPTPALELLDGLPDGAPGHPAGPEDLAWVSFTSGSTGMPKGVLGTHRPLSHFIAWHGERFGLAASDRFSLLSGLAHDPLLRDLFTPLCLGALLAIPRPEELASPGRFAGWMREQGVTVAHLTPALSEVLTGGLDEAREVTLEALRFAFFGGDVLTHRAVERLRGVAPGCACVNYYGATETPQGMGFHKVSLPDRERIPLGKGIDGVQLLVLNAADRLAGVGELGEICIRTPYLAQGYLNDEALTRQRFVLSPFTGAPDDRLYRTGDLGRYLADGAVDLQGRRDNQVKLRGFRIELGEIEAALSALSGVAQAAVIVREDHLVAYVVGELEPEEPRRSFREQLRERLPDYMVPTVIVTLAALPLTPNGKVDRKALPAPDWQGFSETYQAPRTPVEEVLAGIWAEVLGLERVGARDRFFALGGHSLLATRVLSRVRQAFAVELPLRDVFEAPALSELAARIEAALRAGAAGAAPPLVPVPREGSLPLSFAQQRLWFFDQLEPGSPLYNMPLALRIEGLLDRPLLAFSLGETVRRHEVLRTSYAAPEGSPVQVIQPAVPFLLPLVDLSGLPESAREALALQLAEEEAARPFDLAGGPLLRCVLLRLTPEDHVAALTLHHIASDGWSMGILVREVTALYAASPLPELPVQYADFTVWQGSWLRGEVLEREISFWRDQLAGLAPLLELPTDRPRPVTQSYRGASRHLWLPAELLRQIRELGGREGATLFMVLLAGFQALLARYSGQQDLAVGTPVAGRNRLEIEGLIGFFVNTLVLRGDLSGRPSFAELLGRTRETALAAYLHQDVPFEKLVQELSSERSLSHSPLFQVMLTLQNVPVESLESGGLRLRPVSGARRTAKFDLELILQEHEGGLDGVIEYATDLFDAVTIDRLIVHFETLLTAALGAPEQIASELPLLAPSERWQTLHEWNDSARAYPKDLCIQDLFAEQAARTPHAVAVSYEDGRLTYRELDERADRLAQWLIDRGVGMDVLVALLVERSLEMIVALVGILKAGGSYAPLEPGLPPSRLRWLLDDVRSPVLLTQTALLPEVEAAGGFQGPVLLMDGEDPEGPGLGSLVPSRVPSHPLQLAYVNYTSGSTGRPKGVVVPHLGVTRLVINPDYMELGPDDVILQLSTYAWDAATWEIWGALLNGGRLVMIPRETVLDFRRLARVLVEERVTALYLTTALFNQFVEQEGESLAGLSTLIIGGETASVPHFRKAVEMLPRTRIINEYGPTENTSYSSWQLVRGTPEQGGLPIGKPLSNSTVYVLDRGLQPMPLGLPGELFLGGDGLARGYLGRPDLTAERFVPHPFAAGERLYRTGDLGAWRPDGTLDFLGRMDFQVKIRGHRIEPAEVEDAIKRHESVEDAVVMAWEPVPQDRRLAAYVVGDVTVDALRHFLSERLPDYMVPASFVMLAALPLSPTGKVDRKALPAPETQSSGESFVAPRTQIEKVLAGAWAELLGLERIGLTDDFFALGGHSLLAVRLMARIEHLFGVKLPIALLFETPTLGRLATAIQSAPAGRSALVPLRVGGAGRPLFVVHPVGGGVFAYVDLAKQLGAERPVYGLQAVAEGNGHLATMEDLAARYVARVREVQAEGPWLLAGWSSGAVMAYEMARQIEAAGGTTSLLALFDPPAPKKGGERAESAVLLARFAILNGLVEREEPMREILQGLDVEAGLDRLIELAQAAGMLPPDVGKPWLRERFDLYSRTATALQSYLPGPYGGQVTLFRASASLAPEATDLTAGWGLLARTEAHLIPDTDHFTLLQTPGLHRLVEPLKNALAAVEEDE